MKPLVVTALLLCSDGNRLEEDSSLMQGLLARHGQLAISETQNSTKEARKDATARLMETATNMMKNGVTPDVVTFIESTIDEVNLNVLGSIVQEHERDKKEIDDLLGQFTTINAAMDTCRVQADQENSDWIVLSDQHKTCRSEEALACARSRKCEEELAGLWTTVKNKEKTIRDLHSGIHAMWCVKVPADHPDYANDPFSWELEARREGPETSKTSEAYPGVGPSQDATTFRTNSETKFLAYRLAKTAVGVAWTNYNTKLLECAGLEETLEAKVSDCDDLQDDVRKDACTHASNSRLCASTFGYQYHMTLKSYHTAVSRTREDEYDRKREWETLHIVTCLLETVYTHIIQAIDSGAPCPTETTHAEQTANEINECHVIRDDMTANLTIVYGDPPVPTELPTLVATPCSAQYIWDEHGSFPDQVQTSHGNTITQDGLGSYFTTLSSSGWAGCAAPKACIPCESQVTFTDDTYVESSVCKEHQTNLFPGQLDKHLTDGSFKCLRGDQCIRASGRCNTNVNCDDGSDEKGCDTAWGVAAVLNRETCLDPFVADVQFRCSDSTCIPIEGKCNGIANCADGSDESSCAGGITSDILEPTTGLHASIEKAAIGSSVFHDREYKFETLGSFAGYSYVRMSNEDKHISSKKVQIKLRLPHPVIVYVVKMDNHDLEWLNENEGWTLTGMDGVSYKGLHDTRHTDWLVYLGEEHNEATHAPGAVWEKTFPAGTVEMRGNNGGDGSYLIFLSSAPVGALSLSAYKSDGCGAMGKDWNPTWCPYDTCPAIKTTSLCASGEAELVAFNGDGSSASYVERRENGNCNYFWHAQYRCTGSHHGMAEYIGCFDSDADHDMGTEVGAGNSDQTTNRFALCRQRCGSTRYMSLRNGGECFCANTYSIHGPDEASHAAGACGNGPSTACQAASYSCGTASKQAVYEINTPLPGAAEYIGCFKDDEHRDMDTMMGHTHDDTTNTFGKCRTACGSNRYMSLQYGGECFCANDRPDDHSATSSQYPKLDNGACNGGPPSACQAASYSCGSEWAQAIYEINAPSR